MFIVVYICDKHVGALTQFATSYGAFLLLHDCTCVLFSMLPKLYCCLKYFLCWSDCNTSMPLNTSDCCLALSGNVNCTDMLTYRNVMFSTLALVTQVHGTNFGFVQQASVRLSVTLSYCSFFGRCCCKCVCPCLILFQPVMVPCICYTAHFELLLTECVSSCTTLFSRYLISCYLTSIFYSEAMSLSSKLFHYCKLFLSCGLKQ